MEEEFINLKVTPKENSIIKVFGVGGSGGNAVNTMYNQGIYDVEFYIFNTDVQDLEKSDIPNKIQIGEEEMEGLGAGNNPARGEAAAMESLAKIEEVLDRGTKMLFIAAGMGGGTGTGAAPVIAQKAYEKGILTVAIVTFPFLAEGRKRIEQAIKGVEKLKEVVDSLLIVNNQRILEIHGELPLSEAYKKADNILTTAAKGIAEIITLKGFVNVDFADVDSVMRNSGVALMCNGQAEGENRVEEALAEALDSPLLNDNDITGAQNILLNIATGKEGELTTGELQVLLESLQQSSGQESDIIYGIAIDESLGEKLSITIMATGFKVTDITEIATRQSKKKPESVAPSFSSTTTQPTSVPATDTEKQSEETKISESVSSVEVIDDMYSNLDDLDEEPAINRSGRQMSLFGQDSEKETNKDELPPRHIVNDPSKGKSIDDNPYFDKRVD